MLACVAVFFNPNNYKRILNNYFKFKENFTKNIPLYTIEAAFHQYQTDADFKIKANPKNQIMWQKERLINLAISWLPDKYDVVAFSDADVIYPEGWEKELIEKSSQYKVIQNFAQANWLGPDGNIISTKFSACKQKIDGSGGYGAPGLGWTFSREIQLYDRGIIGAGDSFFERSIWNKWWTHPKQIMTEKEYEFYVLWAKKNYEMVQESISYLNITVNHLYHGQQQNRKYIERHEILKSENFDPMLDVYIAKNGLLSWCSYKPKLHENVKKYFAEREEDK